MFVNFLYRLRHLGVPVGVAEALALAEAMGHGLHESNLDDFYYVARAVLVHHEGHLDAFDQAFLAEFKGVEMIDTTMTDELRRWLDEAEMERHRHDNGIDDEIGPDHLSTEQIDELRRRFAERMREQTERHDGGGYWIGTGGTSPFGQAGRSASGLSTGSSGGGRAAVRVADARRYRPYRSDMILDIRQFEVALKRLRAFVREGADIELDIDRTIDATAANAGDIEIITRPPARPDTHVILMIDVGGSMFPYSALMSQLFSATRKATHFRDLRTYYFHNCVYGQVYETDRFTEPLWVPDLMRQCAGQYKLIMVGDALMAPYELSMGAPAAPGERALVTGMQWLERLAQHFPHHVWLNPEPETSWRGTTIEEIGRVFRMFPMTIEGLTEAMSWLNRGSRARR
ncbi:MAG: VWA domain-containing protein [Candidatus Nanopelagicales bacterium]|nr:VWA domain-containing protein [Candidatus Nanopelagicales bacterium]